MNYQPQADLGHPGSNAARRDRRWDTAFERPDYKLAHDLPNPIFVKGIAMAKSHQGRKVSVRKGGTKSANLNAKPRVQRLALDGNFKMRLPQRLLDCLKFVAEGASLTPSAYVRTVLAEFLAHHVVTEKRKLR